MGQCVPAAVLPSLLHPEKTTELYGLRLEPSSLIDTGVVVAERRFYPRHLFPFEPGSLRRYASYRAMWMELVEGLEHFSAYTYHPDPGATDLDTTPVYSLLPNHGILRRCLTYPNNTDVRPAECNARVALHPVTGIPEGFEVTRTIHRHEIVVVDIMPHYMTNRSLMYRMVNARNAEE